MSCFIVCAAVTCLAWGDEPPAINPFAPQGPVRQDAQPGYVELSSGAVRPGRLFLTRDARLKLFDEAKKQIREIPLAVVQRIDCAIVREWVEKEWRFKENASDEKVYSGRSYPAREYVHTVTLRDGRRVKGPLAAIVYVQGETGGEAERFLLHKRDKGAVGDDLKSLVYVRTVRLGDEALREGKGRAARNGKQKP